LINRNELLISYSKKFLIHRRMWEVEWTRRNSRDLSYGQCLILDLLATEGPKQSKELVECFSITSGGITTIADKLLARGLIYRMRSDEQDRRAVFLGITEEGRAAMKEMMLVRDQLFDELFAILTDAEVAFLDHIYGKLSEQKG
jgi:DNA-binding MarR family transcriptional regulator